jgi:hypothetical protein
VHTPEFAFERLLSNVQGAVNGFGIKYPVVLDNQYGTWGAFANQYWPRKYLIDIDGYVVYDHVGEGAYEETEKAIQAALRERNERLGMTSELPETNLVEVAPDQKQVGSPEIYFGSLRNDRFGNGVSGVVGSQELTLPSKVNLNELYLGGAWNIQPEFAEGNMGTNIRFLYKAKSVYFVGSASNPVKIKVTRNGGQPLAGDRGKDVDENGFVTVQEDRLYKLIESDSYGAHLLEIQVEGNGLKAYTFTFG